MMKTDKKLVSEAAAMLGRLNKGMPKTYSAEEIKIRTERLAAARLLRWPAKEGKTDE